MDAAHRTQVWLAVSQDRAATVSGKYFFHLRERTPNPAANDAGRQDALLDACRRFSGIEMPAK